MLVLLRLQGSNPDSVLTWENLDSCTDRHMDRQIDR